MADGCVWCSFFPQSWCTKSNSDLLQNRAVRDVPSQRVSCIAWLSLRVTCQNYIHSRTHTRLIYTTGAEFRAAGVAFCTLRCATPALLTRWVKLENFDLERVFSFGTLHQWCQKFLSGIFYTFWPPYGRKFQFGTCDPKTGKKSWRETLRTIGAEFRRAGGVALCRVQSATPAFWTRRVKFENFDLEKVFSFGTLHQWWRKFLSRNFYSFWPPYGQRIVERNFAHHWCRVPKDRSGTLHCAECQCRGSPQHFRTDE